ncbi:eukaryotic-like serine/threonine-protein kinase [Gammaproteobacteria bacterium]
MEYIRGQNLTAFTKPPNLLPSATVLNLALKIAQALDYAHGQQVVHRDIKPANIMYEPDTGVLKVTDFGIARITDASKTKTGIVLGTPSYMSPEQVTGKRVDGRSDLYSLGAMLYQLLCGELPFRGGSVAQLLFRIANEAPPSLSLLQPDLPPCVMTLLDKALQKDPAERYQTGGDFALDLARCLVMIRRQAGGTR